LLVPVGLWLLFRNPKRERVPANEASPPEASMEARQRFRWVMLVWVVSGLLFLIVSLLTALPIRPMLFLWPPTSLLAGLSLAAFVGGGRLPGRAWTWRKAAAIAVIMGLAALSLYLWALANFLDMREPHVYPLVF
jgi:cation transport ATPase